MEVEAPGKHFNSAVDVLSRGLHVTGPGPFPARTGKREVIFPKGRAEPANER